MHRAVRADARAASAEPRAIVVTEDGVFLWPAIALVVRRGESFERIAAEQLANPIGAFYGPEALLRPVGPALDAAVMQLRHGRVDLAKRIIDAIGLPPISPNGWRLMRAIALRHGLNPPTVPVATAQTGSLWSDTDAALLAKAYDRVHPHTRHLAKVFNPGEPRISAGQPGGGQWTTEGGGEVTPLVDPAPVRLAQWSFFARPPIFPGEIPRIAPEETPRVAPKEAPEAVPRFKEPIPGQSGKEGATDVPSWARGSRPKVDESGKDFAGRLMDEKYGPGKRRGDSDREKEFNQIRKWGDRHFRNSKEIVVDPDNSV